MTIPDGSFNFLRYQLFMAMDPLYWGRVEAAGNASAYRQYLATTMSEIHQILAVDGSVMDLMAAIYKLWDYAHWFDE